MLLLLFMTFSVVSDGSLVSKDCPFALPACPTGAITFVEREAAAYDKAAVPAAKQAKQEMLYCGCPKLDAVSYAEKLTQIFAEKRSRC